MDTLLHVGLGNAVLATLLALVALAASLFCRSRPALVHGLWLLVLLKLITPPIIRIPVPNPAEASARAEVADGATDPRIPETAAQEPPAEEGGLADLPALVDRGDDGAPVGPAPGEGLAVAPLVTLIEPGPAPESQSSATDLSWRGWLLLAWGAGTLAWLALAAVRVARFHRLLAGAKAAPAELVGEVESLARELRLRRAPGVWLVSGRIAPMIWAVLGRPRLLLPAGLWKHLDGPQRTALLVHELAHLRRGDHWVRVVEVAALALYWWHPLVWYACRELREAEEQCCDAWVVSVRPGVGRAYAEALVETLDFLSQSPTATPVLASGVGEVSDLKRRLTMILCGTTPRALSWRGLLAVVALGGLLLPALPTWAQPGEPVDKKPADDRKEEDIRAAETAVRKAEAELQEKMAEVRSAQERLRQAHATVQRLTGKQPSEEKRVLILRAGTPEDKVLLLPARTDGRLADELQRLLERVTENPKDLAMALELLERLRGPRPGTPIASRVLDVPAPPRPPAPPAVKPGTPLHAVPDGRLQQLERRLDEVMRELEHLRREIRPGRRGAVAPPHPEAGRASGEDPQSGKVEFRTSPKPVKGVPLEGGQGKGVPPEGGPAFKGVLIRPLDR